MLLTEILESNYMKKIIAFVAVSSMLAACGTVGNSVISDKNLQQKSSIALNTNPENITISNRRSDGLDSVRFTATANPVLFMRALKVTHFRQLDDPLTVFGLGGTIFGSVFTLSA